MPRGSIPQTVDENQNQQPRMQVYEPPHKAEDFDKLQQSFKVDVNEMKNALQ